MAPGKHISIADEIIATTNTLRNTQPEAIRDQLISLINELINNDFPGLVQLLYRVDIDEIKLKSLLKSHPGADSASIIADLVINRHLQKMALRNQDAGKKENFRDDDDGWVNS